MLLKNFYTALTAVIMHTPIPSGLKEPNGTIRNAYYNLVGSNNISAGWGNLKYSSGLISFGDSNRAPSFDDYCLDGNTITGISVAENVVDTCTDGQVTRKVIYTITNNNTTSITIGEIGIQADCAYASGNSYSRMMIERTTLETPLVIEPSGVGQITYVLSAPVPAAATE